MRPYCTLDGWKCLTGVLKCRRSEPMAVVSGGAGNLVPLKAAARDRPSQRPLAADSTYHSTPVIWPAR